MGLSLTSSKCMDFGGTQGTASIKEGGYESRVSLPWLAFLREWGKALWLGWVRTSWGPCLFKRREEPWVPSLRPHHTGSPVVTPRLIRVNGEVIQSPDEGEVHGGVMGGVALQGQVVPQVDVGTGGGQSDLGCICQENKGPE